MQRKFWTRYLLVLLGCLPLEFVSLTQVMATEQATYLAQSKSAYDEYMRQAYAATRQRNYTRAANLFRQAEKLRPRDRYATAAIRNVDSYKNKRRRIAFFDAGRPQKVRSAGSRGNCFVNNQAVQAELYAIPLVPTSKEIQQTTNAYPTFFFYITESSQKFKALEFVLRNSDVFDSNDNFKPVYREKFKPVGAGIVSITVPANQPALKVGKEYTWSVAMICDERRRDQDIYLEGKIQLIQDENIATQAQPTAQLPELLDQAKLYATAGFWENALSILAKLRRDRPTDPEVQQYWQELLTSTENQELEKVVNQPLLPCCNLQQ